MPEAAYGGDTNFLTSSTSAASGPNTIMITPLDFTIQVASAPSVSGTYGSTAKYTLLLTPIGINFPGDVQFTIKSNGPILATYTFSPNSLSRDAGVSNVLLTVVTTRLAPTGFSGRYAPAIFAALILCLLPMRRLRKTSNRLGKSIGMAALMLIALTGFASLTGCGAGYFDNHNPITVTATSGGMQHAVTVDFHILKSAQDAGE